MKATYTKIAIIGAALSVMYAGVALSDETDDRIESAAKESYVFKTYLVDDDINVSSKNGVVTLKGTVSGESHKSLAKETVASLPKVKSVDDQLEIKGDRPTKMSDAWITTKVKTNIMFHKDVSALNTDVNTSKGVVTLKGEADNEEQKRMTGEYAGDVDGVKEVKNQIIVTKQGNSVKKSNRAKPTRGEKIDDASITGQIKVSLFSHRSTSALNTKVETNDGVVTLRGTAKSKSERDYASKLSYDVYGVKNVNNQMTIEPTVKN